MKKVEKDGKIAVLYSPGYGAGWSTWAADGNREALCMDARIVEPFLQGDKTAAVDAALTLFPDMYTGGAEDLEVMWVTKGSRFLVEEYDGHESVHIFDDMPYLTA
jgi:hypothetical protein